MAISSHVSPENTTTHPVQSVIVSLGAVVGGGTVYCALISGKIAAMQLKRIAVFMLPVDCAW